MKRFTAMFESWRGKYSDSPGAISRHLAERFPQVRQVWAANDDTELPDGVVRVRRHSPQYFARLLAANFVVSNDIISKHLVKGPRVTYLQTWHGIALKAIGYDEDTPQYDIASTQKRMARDVSKWDYLISPAPVFTEIFRRAFAYDGEIIETGYPRNDVLRSSDGAAIGARVRRTLGVADDAHVVLYAPTWRDDSHGASGGFEDPGALDIDSFLEHVDDKTVLLVRMHDVVRTRVGGGDYETRVIDVSDYPEVSELFLATDVLVSDYSSAVNDFAVTGKPIVLFAYDLDHYRTEVRRMYFDYETWAPGPVVTTTEELARAVGRFSPRGDPATAAAEYATAYRRFVERFCPYEDGHASERAVDLVFRPIIERG